MPRPLLPSLLAGLCAIVLGGCSPFPDLDARVSAEAKAAPFPDLAPTAPILASVPPPTAEAAGDALDARAAGLRGRAGALRGQPVLDPDSRARLSAVSP